MLEVFSWFVVDLLPGGFPTCVGLAGTLDMKWTECIFIFIAKRAMPTPLSRMFLVGLFSRNWWHVQNMRNGYLLMGQGYSGGKRFASISIVSILWTIPNHQQWNVVDVACVKCSSEGKERGLWFQWIRSVREVLHLHAGGEGQQVRW